VGSIGNENPSEVRGRPQNSLVKMVIVFSMFRQVFFVAPR